MSVNYITIDESEFDKLVAENAKLRKRLEVAVEGLEKIINHEDAGWGYRECADIHDAIIVIAKEALKMLEP